MGGRYLDVLTDPATFFERETGAPAVAAPILVVLLVGVLGAVSFWIEWSVVSEFVAAAAEQAARDGQGDTANVVSMVTTIGGTLGVVFALVMALVGWAYYGLLFYGLSALMSGEGEFTETMLFVAWGFVPKVVEMVVQILGNAYLTTVVTVPETFDEAGRMAYQQQIAANPMSLLLVLVGIASLFWSAYIWHEGLQVSRDLDSRQALVAVAIPVGLVLLTRLVNLVNLLT